MKPVLFAAVLMLGGAAVAQTTTTTGTTTTETTADTSTDQTEAEATTSTSTSTGMATTSTTMATGMTVAPGNDNPERDARGIAVVSAPATAPAGWNSAPQVGGTGASASQSASTMGAAGPLPPCSRTVTDRCTQTYERGVRR